MLCHSVIAPVQKFTLLCLFTLLVSIRYWALFWFNVKDNIMRVLYVCFGKEIFIQFKILTTMSLPHGAATVSLLDQFIFQIVLL